MDLIQDLDLRMIEILSRYELMELLILVCHPSSFISQGQYLTTAVFELTFYDVMTILMLILPNVPN